MVYTVSGIVLHRLRRMIRVGDGPREAADVVGRMVREVERIDADFFERVGERAPVAVTQRVAFVRPVDRDNGDVAAPFGQDCVFH